MLSKLSKRSATLVAAGMAVCALAMPMTASAATWGVVGTTHVLDGGNFTFSVPAINGAWTCANARFDVDVRSTMLLTITGASFGGCVGLGAGLGCTITFSATHLPWVVTGISTSFVSMAGIDFDLTYENLPGTPLCTKPGSITLTGTLTSTGWDAATHQLTYATSAGLTEHGFFLPSAPTTVTGTLRDSTQSLTLSH